jgi:hypothetical protein
MLFARLKYLCLAVLFALVAIAGPAIILQTAEIWMNRLGYTSRDAVQHAFPPTTDRAREILARIAEERRKLHENSSGVDDVRRRLMDLELSLEQLRKDEAAKADIGDKQVKELREWASFGTNIIAMLAGVIACFFGWCALKGST